MKSPQGTIELDARPGNVLAMEPERAGPARHLSGLSAADVDSRREDGRLPASCHDQRSPARPQGRGRTDSDARVPQGTEGQDGAAADGPRVRPPLRERRLFRRRDEAGRDSANGHAAAEVRHPRRNRQRPGRRRRAAGQPEHRRDRRRRDGHPDHHAPRQLLEHNRPDFTHVMLGGRIVETGGAELADGTAPARATTASAAHYPDAAADEAAMQAPRQQPPAVAG